MKKWINIAGELVDFGNPKIMGILNATPDSFYGRSRASGHDSVTARVSQMIAEGAELIDVGGYSTRPGAEEVSVQEEIARVVPVIKHIKGVSKHVIISLDTFRSEVAKEGVKAGAHIINDVSGGTLDAEMFKTIAALQVPYILMHMRGNPQNMIEKTSYGNIGREVILDLQGKINKLTGLGVKDIIVDPGLGFAKTAKQSLQLIDDLDVFQILEIPILVGLSRKSMIYKTLETNAEGALNGTTILQTKALLKGAHILRVHDVKEAVETRTLVCPNGGLM